MIDAYFKSPIFWDYFFAALLSSGAIILWNNHLIISPKEEYLYSFVSDLATIALTMAGFILTLLTVLISFKSTSKQKRDSISESDTVFELFFSTQLYFETVIHLKNAIKSLTLMAVVGYCIKLTLNLKNYPVLFIYNIFGIIIVFFTVWRCLLILSKIIKIQQEN